MRVITRLVLVLAVALFGIMAVLHVRGLLGIYPDSDSLTLGLFLGVFPIAALGFMHLRGRRLREMFSSKWQWIVLGLGLAYASIDMARYAEAGTQRTMTREDHGHYYVRRPDQGETEVTEAAYHQVDGAKTAGFTGVAAYLYLVSALLLFEQQRKVTR